MLPCSESFLISQYEPVVWASEYWQGRMVSTLKSKKADWRLNSEIYQIVMEVNDMAKVTKKLGDNLAKSSATNIQWVNVSITDEDILALTEWLDAEPNILVEIMLLVNAGYSFGCKPANDGDGYMATLIGRNFPDGSVTYGLSAYAGNAYDACGSVLYKFVSKLDRKFPETAIQGMRRFR